MNYETICLENTEHRQTRWLRTMPHDSHFYVIESTKYATLNKGYVIKFNDHKEFDQWLDEQRSSGWTVTYSADHQPQPVDLETLHQIELNVFKTLRS